jgi:hypothetical protein
MPAAALDRIFRAPVATLKFVDGQVRFKRDASCHVSVLQQCDATRYEIGLVPDIQRLHTRRMEFPKYGAIRDAVLATLPWGTFFSVADIVDDPQDSFAEVRDSFAKIQVELSV